MRPREVTSTLPTPSNGTYTFKQGTVTGIYGVLVQASDSRANE